MMSIKLGELVDQPRHVRVQALAAEQEKKKRAEEERVAKLAKARYPPTPTPTPTSNQVRRWSAAPWLRASLAWMLGRRSVVRVRVS